MKKTTLFFVALSISIAGLFAQNRVAQPVSLPTNDIIPSERTCATMDMISQEELDAFQEWLEPQVQAYLQSQQQSGNPEVVYTIPTIVHIIHNSNEGIGSGRNLSNARIQSQINILNNDFRKTNSDIGSVPSMFAGITADSEINFCLIQTYPTGHPNAGQALPEPGVDRVDATTIGGGIANTTTGYSTSQIDGTIKPATSWNPNQVLNIWVMQLQGGLLGYAQFPNSGNANTDGVAIGYQYFGNNPSANPFHLGRTTTHELGHYFGLRHIWGDQNCGNDFVADTPTQQTSSSGCPNHPRPTCGNTGDNFQNYMDYTDDACMFMFTNGQKAVMQGILNPSTGANRRKTLNAASATLCAAAPLTANFTASATTITAGQSITFTNTSGGPNPITSNSWNFDVTSQGGVSPSTSSVASPGAVTYNNAGTYSVSLLVGDGTNTDSEIKNSYITVLPPGGVICNDITNYSGTASLLGSGGTGAFGWISGHNNFDDRAKADKFPAPAPGLFVNSVELQFAKKHAGTSGSTITVNVWNANGTGGIPGTLLGSQTVAVSSLNLYPTPTQVTFASPIAVTGAYYVGITFSANTGNSTQDSVALITNADGETNPGTAWERWNDNSWHAYSETPASWGLNMSHSISVELCNTATGVNELVKELPISIFPNPAKDIVNVILPSTENNEISVYNVLGEVVYQNNNPTSNKISINLSNQPNGVYFIKAKSGNQLITKKLMLTK